MTLGGIVIEFTGSDKNKKPDIIEVKPEFNGASHEIIIEDDKKKLKLDIFPTRSDQFFVIKNYGKDGKVLDIVIVRLVNSFFSESWILKRNGKQLEEPEKFEPKKTAQLTAPSDTSAPPMPPPVQSAEGTAATPTPEAVVKATQTTASTSTTALS